MTEEEVFDFVSSLIFFNHIFYWNELYFTTINDVLILSKTKSSCQYYSINITTKDCNWHWKDAKLELKELKLYSQYKKLNQL